ncbi:MAG TPA: SDR family oxidoreductase [Mycobacterium sp.]|nr:SDR family oxidoreductase [Mycobacterium sp.]
MSELAYVLSHGDDAVTEALVRALEQEGWRLVVRHGAADVPPVTAGPVTGVVYVPGLLAESERLPADPAVALMDLVAALRPRLSSAGDGGARVVVVGSRDWLGWPSRPLLAAKAAGLVAATRSLALAHGQAGVTVNAVVGMPPEAADLRDAGPAPGTHLYEPVPLTGAAVTPEDIAAAVMFFLDRRSGYLTGQILHCCGGASLLSSLSV